MSQKIRILLIPLATHALECGVYLAPSTIPGAGLGIFAGKNYGAWKPIGRPDIVIPVVDYSYHNPENDHIIFDIYGWNLPSFAHADVEGVASIAFIPGTGAALNCMMSLVNTVGMDDLVIMDSAGMHRSKDPGVGAFTPFHNRQLVSRGGIVAGAELFDSYGIDYFSEREDVFGKIPLYETDYQTADELLDTYLNLQDALCADIGTCDPGNLAKSSLYTSTYGLMSALTSIWPSRALNALPQDSKVALDLLDDGGTKYTHYDRSIRSLDWLEQHGLCMDWLEIRNSTIPQAGRGAYASRDLSIGTVIAPAPAIHMSRSVLKIYPRDFSPTDGTFFYNDSKPIEHYQLVLNYCFGHRHSSIMLCPYGSMTGLINHSREKANAKIDWNMKMMQHPEWLQLPPDKFTDDHHSGLMFNYVAIRDIKTGEEIFIDYGEEWEDAWKAHVESWTPPKLADKYIPAHVLDKDEVIRTIKEEPYREEYVHLKCREEYRIWSGLPPNDDGEASVDCRAVSRTTIKGEDIYTAEILEYSTTEDQTLVDVQEVLFNVPRDAFHFVDRLYSRDHAQPWSFRHDMRIPDSMMPPAWLDMR